ncbi:MAG: hypothetical protein JNL11_09580 [Bdellovibrionaceae bacterium]|nr:hypothetical protein [Pseudobdellovibrionaceae bacterium]
MKQIRRLACLVFLVVSSSFASGDIKSLDLGRYWIQDRFIRAVTLARNDHEKLAALNALIVRAKAHKEIKGVIPEHVISADELAHVRSAYLHPQGTVQSEIEYFLRGQVPLPKILVPAAGVEREFERVANSYRRLMDIEFSFPPQGMLAGFLNFVGAVSQRNVTFFDLLFENSRDSWLAITAMQQKSDQEKLQYLNKLSEAVQSVAKTIRTSGGKLLENTQLKIKDPKAKRFMEIVLTEYFSQLPESVIWNLIFLQMERPEVETVLERFQLFSRNVGPHLHKIFQMVSTEEGVPVELSTILKTFQENLPPARSQDVAALLNNLQFSEFEILQLDEKPIKVGSMAQVHKARVRFHYDGQERFIAVRLIKPGIEAMIEMDERFLDSVLDTLKRDPLLSDGNIGENYSKFISDLIQLVREELNARATQKNQNQAVSLLGGESKILSDGSKLSIEVPAAYMSNKDAVIASDWVAGVSLEDFYARQPEKAREVAEILFTNWMEKAILSTGFIHADMQPGNIKIDASINSDRIKAHIIDYGMAGVIGPEGRELFMLMAIGATLKNSKALARSVYLQANNKENFSFEQVEALAKTFLESESSETAATDKSKSVIEKAVGLFVKNGVELDTNFVMLARGFKAAQGLVNMTKSTKKPSEMLADLFRKNPALMTRTLGSFNHLSLLEAGGLVKDGVVEAGTRAAKTVIENPQVVVEQGKKLFGFGKGLLNRAKELANDVRDGRSPLNQVFALPQAATGEKINTSSFAGCAKFYAK